MIKRHPNVAHRKTLSAILNATPQRTRRISNARNHHYVSTTQYYTKNGKQGPKSEKYQEGAIKIPTMFNPGIVLAKIGTVFWGNLPGLVVFLQRTVTDNNVN